MTTRVQPIGRYVALLCLGTVVPTILCSALLLQQLVADQGVQAASRAQGSADRLTTLLDGKLLNLTAVVQALATSPLLDDGNVAAFRAQALRAAEGQDYGLVLQSAQGERLVDTSLPAVRGATSSGGPPALQTVLESGRAKVSSVYRDDTTGRPLIAVSVPVVKDGAVNYVLSATQSPSKLLASISPPNVNRTWRIELVDRKGASAASIGPSIALGGPQAVARSKVSDWRLAVRGPRVGAFSVATGRARDRIVAFGVVTTLFGLAAAGLLGRSMSRSLKRVRNSAHALAGDGRETAPGSSIREIRDVEEALEKVALLLREQTTQKDQHAAALADLNANLETRVSDETRELAHANARLESEAGERAAVEAQLRQMQKLEAVGQLTGGIAHDFNNMLSVVIGSIELAQRQKGPGQGHLDRLLSDALSGAQSAAALTRQLLAFGRQQSLSPRKIDLNEVVFGMRDMLQRTLGEKVVVDLRLSGDLWPSFLDRPQTESSLVNLAINARDAMPSGGTLTVETTNVSIDEATSSALERVAPGDYTVVTISDTGTGIPPELLSRVIDPFFTTKEIGKGTGLGLSQVHGFLRQSNGYLRIYSEQGSGTTVRLYVPRHDSQRDERSIGVDDQIDTSEKEKIVFVVEDNDVVREASVRGIRELGYEVIHASSGEEALKRLAVVAKVDLLFTDVIMPGMNGRELAEAASRAKPGIKVVYATGYSKNVALNGLVDKGRPVIEKPFTLNQLATFLQQALTDEAA